MIEDRERGLLVFAGEFSAANQNEFFFETDRDDRIGSCSVTLGVRLKARRVYDGVFGNVSIERINFRPVQQVAKKQRMPTVLCYQPYIHRALRICSAFEILHFNLLVFQVCKQVASE